MSKEKATKLQALLSGQPMSGQAGVGGTKDADSAATRRAHGGARTDLWLPANLVKSLDAWAKGQGLSRTDAIENILRQTLKV